LDLQNDWILKVEKNWQENVIVVSKMELVPDTNPRSPSAIERHKMPVDHLSLNWIVTQLGHHIIVGQSFFFFKLRDIDCFEFFRVRHLVKENEKMMCGRISEEVKRGLEVQRKFEIRMAEVWKEYLY
jgi:hypothetical protein